MSAVIFDRVDTFETYTIIDARGRQRFAHFSADTIERKAARLDLRDKLRASVGEG